MAKRKQESIGHEERAKIRRLSAAGASLDHIALFWEVEVAAVQQILTEPEGQESAQNADDEVVKRLMKDPEELCCPLAHSLMDDPVVAGDGITYERAMVEECFSRMPHKSPMTGLPISTTVLNPNQHMKSLTLAFKEETVKEILSVVPTIARPKALELLRRGEDFVRPLLPDASAKRTLATLLMLRLKPPGADSGEVAQEVVTLLVQVQDEGSLQEAVVDMEESDLMALLSAIDEETVSKLHEAMVSCNAPCKGLVTKELARRLATRLNDERLKSLWVLIEANESDEGWMQAAACLLAAHMSRLGLDLSSVGSVVLAEAGRFLDNQDAAIAFAKGFFNYDLGISTSEQWPQKSTACICHELARRSTDEKPEEKLQLLLQGHRIDDSHTAICKALAEQLRCNLLRDEAAGTSDMEGLFLKLALQEGQDLPVDILSRLTLHAQQLSQASPKQLMILAEQLGKHNRRADAAQVAVAAARAFQSDGQGRKSEEAFLKAFGCDPANREAAQGLAEAVASGHQRCNELEARCAQQVEESRRVSEEKLQELRAQLERQLETKLQIPRLEIGSALAWDLSGYDFTSFVKGQVQRSEEFQLPRGIKAWMSLYPKGHANSSEGSAGLYLCVDKPAVVKWSFQSGSSERTFERDFSKSLVTADGMPDSWGNPHFMPISQANGRIAVCLLSVRATSSNLSVQPEVLARLDIGSSLLWDLSSYDFSNFTKGKEQKSEKFQLPGGINAWMELYPKGCSDSDEGMAGLFLHVDKPALVKWTMQSGSSEARTEERDFSKDLTADGTPQGFGWRDFMPISEANGRITLRILSVRAPGSTLSLS